MYEWLTSTDGQKLTVMLKKVITYREPFIRTSFTDGSSVPGIGLTVQYTTMKRSNKNLCTVELNILVWGKGITTEATIQANYAVAITLLVSIMKKRKRRGWGRCLLCKHEDPSLVPRSQLKNFKVVAFAVSVLGKWRLGLEGSWPVCLSKTASSRLNERLCPNSDISLSSLHTLLYALAHIRAHTSMCMHRAHVYETRWFSEKMNKVAYF